MFSQAQTALTPYRIVILSAGQQVSSLILAQLGMQRLAEPRQSWLLLQRYGLIGIFHHDAHQNSSWVSQSVLNADIHSKTRHHHIIMLLDRTGGKRERMLLNTYEIL